MAAKVEAEQVHAWGEFIRVVEEVGAFGVVLFVFLFTQWRTNKREDRRERHRDAKLAELVERLGRRVETNTRATFVTRDLVGVWIQAAVGRSRDLNPVIAEAISRRLERIESMLEAELANGQMSQSPATGFRAAEPEAVPVREGA
jgi:hypothetical protein